MSRTNPLSSQRFTHRRVTIVIFILITGLLAISLTYAGIKTRSGLSAFDMPIAQWAVNHRTPPMTVFMQLVSSIMNIEIFVTAIVLGAAAWMWRKKEYWRPSLLLVSIGIAFLVSTFIKIVVERQRPPFEHMVLPLETGFSFPSNHVFGITILALVLGYLVYSRHRSDKKLFVIWICATIIAALLMSMSRIYLGYHWFTDVTASVGLALVILAFVILIDTCFSLRKLDPPNSTKAL